MYSGRPYGLNVQCHQDSVIHLLNLTILFKFECVGNHLGFLCLVGQMKDEFVPRNDESWSFRFTARLKSSVLAGFIKTYHVSSITFNFRSLKMMLISSSSSDEPFVNPLFVYRYCFTNFVFIGYFPRS